MASTLRRVLAAPFATRTASGCSNRTARKRGTGVSSAHGRPRALASILLPVLLAGSACASASKPEASSPEPSPTVTAAFPVTVAATNGAVSIKHRPLRIVSLSPTATEMLFAIDAGSQVVAVDDDSNYTASSHDQALGLPAERRGHRQVHTRPGGDLQRHR